MKSRLLVLVLSVMLFASCSGDDDKGASLNMDNLQKKWYAVSYTPDGGEPLPNEGPDECGSDYIEFMADGVFKYVDIHECEIWEGVGTYTVEGKQITTIIDGGTEVGTVKKLTSKDLVTEFSSPAQDGEPAMKYTITYKSSL